MLFIEKRNQDLKVYLCSCPKVIPTIKVCHVHTPSFREFCQDSDQFSGEGVGIARWLEGEDEKHKLKAEEAGE